MAVAALPTSAPVARRTTSSRIHVGEGLDIRRPPLFISVLMVLGYGGVVVLRPAAPQKLAFVDPALLLLCVYSLFTMIYQGSRATSGALRILPWFWLILLGSFLGLSSVGIPLWAIDNLSRTVFALLTFVCMWHLITVARLYRMAIAGTVVGVVVTTVMLVATSKYRGAALFQHPNYAGHYMVMACAMLLAVSKRWYWRAAVLLALAIAIQQTGSFGAMAMILAMLAVVGFRFLTRNTAILAAALAILAIGGLFMATPQAADLVPTDESGFYISESISAQRFERSSDTRFSLWAQAMSAYAQEPWGIGPDGVRRREVARWRGSQLEIHSDAIGYLVERGVVGLIGFIGVWVTLWRLAKRGGLARIFIAGMVVQGLFRETMHYRHMWLLLALAFAIDYARPPPEEDSATVPDGESTETAYFPGAARWPAGPSPASS